VKHKIIGISGYARVGKDTAATYIRGKLPNYEIASFADPIKAMLKVGLGMTHEQMYGNEIREEIDERYGCTPRMLMQTLGTEWGRNMIDQNIWVQAMLAHIDRTGNPTIIPDVRFESEAEMIRQNGKLIHIIGNRKLKSEHSSESGIYIQDGDLTIDNTGSLDEFYLKLEKLVRKHLK
jgi:hypothetical protein